MLWLGWARGSSAVAITSKGAEPSGLDRLRNMPLGKFHIREVSTWKNALGKLPHGKIPLEKYLISAPYKVLNITSGILTLCLVA